MKNKKILMAFLVALLVFVAVGSVASGHRVESIQQNAPNDRRIELLCNGAATFRARATFWWTKDGKRVGDPIRLACRKHTFRTKTAVYPRGANDFKVRIRFWDSETSSTCMGRQTFPARQVPPAYSQKCFLPGSSYSYPKKVYFGLAD